MHVVPVIRHGRYAKRQKEKLRITEIPHKEAAMMVGLQRILLTVFLPVILLSRVSLLFF